MPKALNKYSTREDGFTLVELLIVVLIIGILAAIAIPIYLGIQGNSHKAAVRADVNIAVKKVQVNLTEGSTVTAQYGITAGSEKGETVQVKASTSSAAAAYDFMVIGNESKANTPAGAIDYTYQYDSVTGKFSDSDNGDIPLGGASQAKVAITTSTLANANTSDVYTQIISVTNTNTSGSNVFTITGLPAGLGYSTSTGTVSGTPTTTGTSNITVGVTNGSVSDSRNYTLTTYSKPTITTTTLTNPIINQAYSQTLAASGVPNGGFTFAKTSGNLPDGLALNTATGEIAGTPTTNGSYTFAVAASNAAGQGAAQSYTVTVGSAPTIIGSTTSATTIWPAFSQIKYTPSEQPVTTGYPSPTVTATNLPSGLSIDNSTGLISGVPATSGTYSNIVLTATNSYGSSSKTVSMNVVAGNNNYQYNVEGVQSNSVGKLTYQGWAVGQLPGTPGGSASGDTSKANLRVDVYVDSTNYDFYSTDVSRPDVNAAFGGGIGNNHGFNITLNATSGSHNVRIYLRDSTAASGATQIYSGTVVVK